MPQSPAQTHDVVAIGNAIMDVITSCDDAHLTAINATKGGMSLIDPETAEHLSASLGDHTVVSGGSAANTAAGIASLGGKPRFIGKVGNDALGANYAKDLLDTGVKFTSIPLQDGPPTGRCLVYVTPDGERTMMTLLGAAQHLSPDDIHEDDIASAQITFLEGYLFDPEDAKRAFAKAAAFAQTHERKVALTLSDTFCVHNHREGFEALIQSQVDILFANEAEMKALAQTDDLTAALQHAQGLCPVVVVTRSEQGSVVFDHGATTEIHAVAVPKVVDTTGAGDLYAAGFLYGLARGKPMAECGHIASVAAAEVISHYGARPEVKLDGLLKTPA